MSKPKRKTDKLSIELKFMGCPYDSDDPRAGIWLAGYRACIQDDLKQFQSAAA
jgi:hypothetical protein